MAPVAATLAATAAVGVGVALARAGSERRSRRRLRADRRLELRFDESVATGLRRMALAQSDLALEQLEAAGAENPERAIHETRKAIKRLRTIVRLLEGQLGPDVCEREQSSLRRAATGLAAARDAGVMLATLDALVRRHPDRLAGRRGIARLRAQLLEERERAERQTRDPAIRLPVTEELRAFRSRAAGWPLVEHPGIAPVEVGLRQIYRQGRRRARRVARSGGGRMTVMHQWRKRVKDLRYAAETIQRATPRHGPLRPASRSSRARAREQDRWLRRLAGRADELGELLGEEHDLAVLGMWIETSGKRSGLGRATRRRLLKLIARRRSELRRRALRRGMRLYGRRPSQFMTRVSVAYQRCAPRLS
ncbi:MAG: CHAD domain-containing protein [Solirubrobacteraceae bacterium]